MYAVMEYMNVLVKLIVVLNYHLTGNNRDVVLEKYAENILDIQKE